MKDKFLALYALLLVLQAIVYCVVSVDMRVILSTITTTVALIMIVRHFAFKQRVLLLKQRVAELSNTDRIAFMERILYLLLSSTNLDGVTRHTLEDLIRLILENETGTGLVLNARTLQALAEIGVSSTNRPLRQAVLNIKNE